MDEHKRKEDAVDDETRWENARQTQPEVEAEEAAAPGDETMPEVAMTETPTEMPTGETAMPISSEPAMDSMPAAASASGKKNRTTILVLLAAVALLGAGWYYFFGGNDSLNALLNMGGDGGAAVGTTRSYPEVIASINGEDVSRDELVEVLANMGREVQQQGVDLGDATTQKILENQALTSLLNTKLILQAAAAQGIVSSDAEVDSQVASLKEQVGGEEAFTERLQTMGVTEEAIRADIAKQYVINEYLTKYTDFNDVAVSDEEIQAFYDQVAGNSTDTPPLEAVRDQVVAQVTAEKQQTIVAGVLESLKADAEIEIYIQDVVQAQ